MVGLGGHHWTHQYDFAAELVWVCLVWCSIDKVHVCRWLAAANWVMHHVKSMDVVASLCFVTIYVMCCAQPLRMEARGGRETILVFA